MTLAIRLRKAMVASSSPSTSPKKRTPPRAPSRRAASVCSRRRRATKAAVSAPASQAPFEPSVHTSRLASQPASAHFASVAPQAELDVVGVRPHRECPGRHRHIDGGHCSAGLNRRPRAPVRTLAAAGSGMLGRVGAA